VALEVNCSVIGLPSIETRGSMVTVARFAPEVPKLLLKISLNEDVSGASGTSSSVPIRRR
jgi:hypothetical protein